MCSGVPFFERGFGCKRGSNFSLEIQRQISDSGVSCKIPPASPSRTTFPNPLQIVKNPLEFPRNRPRTFLRGLRRFNWDSIYLSGGFLSFSNLGTAYFLGTGLSPFFERGFSCKMVAVFHWECSCNFLTGVPAVKSHPNDLLAQLSEIHSKSSKTVLNCDDFPLDFRRSQTRTFLWVFRFSNLDTT